jgi:hypothetical protein
LDWMEAKGDETTLDAGLGGGVSVLEQCHPRR